MTSLKIPMLPKLKAVVKKGDRISKGALLAEIPEGKIPKIALHNLLNVGPSKIGKYLVKKVGEKVRKGEIIAKKRGVFSTIQIKSPVDGIFTTAESMPGFIKIKAKKGGKIISPVSGIISGNTGRNIIIETEEEVLAAESGKGNSQGRLIRLDNGSSVFKIDKNVNKKIVFGKNITATAIAKISALGGSGVILDREVKDIGLPYIIIENLNVLDNFVGKVVKIVNCGGGSFLVIRGNG